MRDSARFPAALPPFARMRRRTGTVPRGLLLGCALIAAAATAPGRAQERPAASRADRLVEAAIERTTHDVAYDGSYRRIPYPGGDVPDGVGVCTDLVIRAFRSIGVDLQRLVHEDMAREFDAYPKLWGLERPDANIDHRRVPNLRTFFRRHGESLPVGGNADDYHPGDLVTWRLPGNLPHIGIVTGRRSEDGLRPLVAHNIGRGPELEDMIFRYDVTGHYRYLGPE